jgi:cellulose synthase operon protein C
MEGAAPAQTPSQTASPLSAAEEALNRGRFDEVDTLLQNATDPAAALLRARAAIARGRYDQAEQLLTGLAARAPGGEGALELGLLQFRLGRRTEATRTLNRVVNSANPRTAADYLRLGRAARALGAHQDANSFFRRANQLAPDDPAVNTAWGELFFERHDPSEALRSFEDALRANENHVPARVGVARVAQGQNPPAARAAVERALETNPNFVPAHLLAAELALDNRQRDEARASIESALAINPNSLEARSLHAAIAFLEDRLDDFERQAKEVLALNPLYGEVYRVAGDHAARNYRFDEAVDLVRRALAIDADHTQAYADLGMHLMRTGDEPGARRALERAWKDDRSNYVTFNLLELLDKIDTFETIEDGNIIMRLHPEEVGVMREYALPLARQALDTLSAQYEFTVAGPILIEMFPVHDDFAVRNVGLPGMVGALGACFGRVVTLDSPRARPPGEFNWAETLWHEIAHVITLQMSNNRLPRWLSEGISVWEERRARPDWGREMHVRFAQALNEGRALKLDALNEAFTDPRTISLAYYQSSLVVDHLVETYGEPALREFLRAFGRGLDTDDALQEAFGAGFDVIQTAFDAKLEREFGSLRLALRRPEVGGTPSVDELSSLAAANPGSFPLQMELARALRGAEQPDAAVAALERAAALVPQATGAMNPHAIIADIAVEQGDIPRAIEALRSVLRVDHADVESARKLALLVAPLGDPVLVEEAYQRIVEIDPFDAQAQTTYGRAALERRDFDAAARAFRAALATNPTDRASAHLHLAEAYVEAGRFAEARRETLSALEIAPSFERAQDLLLRLVDAGR